MTEVNLLDPRHNNIIMIVDSMAAKYGMLPTEILAKGSTQDLQFHIHAETLRDRETKKARGEDISDTFTQAEISEVYKRWRKDSN